MAFKAMSDFLKEVEIMFRNIDTNIDIVSMLILFQERRFRIYKEIIHYKLKAR